MLHNGAKKFPPPSFVFHILIFITNVQNISSQAQISIFKRK